MKRMNWMAIAALFLLTASFASAQSLGDVARSTRKGKTQTAATNHKYDNDNLPKDDHLSVVGPSSNASTPAADGTNQQAQGNSSGQTIPTPATTTDPKAAAAERQKAADDLKDKLDAQKQKVEALNHELDLTQREYKLRAVAMYSDAGNRLRNASTWDKEDADYKKQIEEKQKAVDAARQELDEMNEQARKAGIRQKDE
jgi:hypothetical protein